MVIKQMALVIRVWHKSWLAVRLAQGNIMKTTRRPEAQTELEGVDGDGHQGLAHVVARGETGVDHHVDH